MFTLLYDIVLGLFWTLFYCCLFYYIIFYYIYVISMLYLYHINIMFYVLFYYIIFITLYLWYIYIYVKVMHWNDRCSIVQYLSAMSHQYPPHHEVDEEDRVVWLLYPTVPHRPETCFTSCPSFVPEVFALRGRGSRDRREARAACPSGLLESF